VADRDPEQAIVLRSTLSRGLPLPGATNSSQQPNADFTIWLGQAQYVHALPGASQVIARADAQLSSSPLFPFEQIAIGGPTTVRGYIQNLEVRDNGVIASLEGRIPILTLPLPHLSDKEGDGVLQLAPFFDVGSGWNTRGPTPQPRTISSIDAGLRWSVNERILAQIYYGHALNHVRQPGHSLQGEGVYFRLTATP
jgi:hemolysin activation/secretion protein